MEAGFGFELPVMNEILAKAVETGRLTWRLKQIHIWDHDLKIEVQENDHRPTKYLKDSVYVCQECGTETAESKMVWKPAVFQGWSPAACPHCGSEKYERKEFLI